MSCDKKVVFFRQFSATRKEMPENNAFLNKNSQGKIFLWLFLSAEKKTYANSAIKASFCSLVSLLFAIRNLMKFTMSPLK